MKNRNNYRLTEYVYIYCLFGVQAFVAQDDGFRDDVAVQIGTAAPVYIIRLSVVQAPAPPDDKLHDHLVVVQVRAAASDNMFRLYCM